MTHPDRWLMLTVHSSSPELRSLAADALIEIGGSAIVEDGDAVTTYLPELSDPGGVTEELRARLAREWPGTELRVSWEWQPDEDWARSWKRGLQPRQITDRLVVKPTWTEWTGQGGEVVIDVDPQMAFGTGEHGTTRGCLRLLDGALRRGDRVLDVGSGSAILSIAAARLGAGEVVAVEYDPDANLNAHENLERNGVQAQVRIVEAMADSELLAELGRFDLVVANILSGVIRPLLPAFRTALTDGGRLIVSGILVEEHAQVVRDARASGLRVAIEDREDEWWSALLLPNGS